MGIEPISDVELKRREEFLAWATTIVPLATGVREEQNRELSYIARIRQLERYLDAFSDEVAEVAVDQLLARIP